MDGEHKTTKNQIALQKTACLLDPQVCSWYKSQFIIVLAASIHANSC